MTDQTQTPGDPWAGYTPFRYRSDAPAVELERVDLFYMDDKAYTAPKRISAAAALRCLEVAAKEGVAAGTYQVLLDSIGQEALDILSSAKQVPYEEAQEMISRLGRVYYGQAMELAGK